MTGFTGQSFGRYHLIEQLGQGGMATVYRAFDTRLEREVAVKVFRRTAFSPEMLERMLKRFEREAKSLAKLTHANIVPIMDYGDYEGTPFLVMPLIGGGTIKELLEDRLDKKMGGFSCKEAVRLLLPIARAVDYAHRRGLLHRDIKPSNILLTEDGDPLLTDFGVAKILEETGPATLTGTGVGVGTPEYMAPEQWLGQAEPASDQYSLGVVFYELLTGRKPYTAETPAAVFLKQMNDPLPRPRDLVPNLPEAAERIIFKTLAKKSADRYSTIAELITALEKLSTNDSPGEGATEETHRPDLEVTEIRPVIGPLPPVPPAEISAKISPAEKPFSEKHPESSPVTDKKESANLAKPPARIFLWIGGIVLVLAILAVLFFVFRYPVSGTRKIRKTDGMVEVYVPQGEFEMGSNDNDKDEQPTHTVYLDAFWIDRTEVTNAQYARCVADGACSKPVYTYTLTHESYYGSDRYKDFPVVYISWSQAENYCRWAGGRLPTEAEWEKAARGTDGRIYPWGNIEPDARLLNFNKKMITGPAKVGSYPAGAGPYGALDMAGNVSEWVADWWASNYYRQSPFNNPAGPAFGDYRVRRGGSYVNDENLVRSSNRTWESPFYTGYDYGFRCARDVYVKAE